MIQKSCRNYVDKERKFHAVYYNLPKKQNKTVMQINYYQDNKNTNINAKAIERFSSVF